MRDVVIIVLVLGLLALLALILFRLVRSKIPIENVVAGYVAEYKNLDTVNKLNYLTHLINQNEIIKEELDQMNEDDAGYADLEREGRIKGMILDAINAST